MRSRVSDAEIAKDLVQTPLLQAKVCQKILRADFCRTHWLIAILSARLLIIYRKNKF